LHFADHAADLAIDIDSETRHADVVLFPFELELEDAVFIPQEFFVHAERKHSQRHASVAVYARSDMQSQTLFHRKIVGLRYTSFVPAVGIRH
jgi:hypothetical protein